MNVCYEIKIQSQEKKPKSTRAKPVPSSWKENKWGHSTPTQGSFWAHS